MYNNPYEVIQEGIIYLFQYGYITEAKHFKMLDALEKTDINDPTNKGRKF